MTKVEKVKKLMEKYGLKLSDLEDVEDDVEETKTEPKQEEPKATEEPKKEEPKVEGEEPKKELEEPKVQENPVENGATEQKEEPIDPYKVQFEDLNKKYEDLKALVEAQAMKVDKSYEILDAQGKMPKDDDNDFELAKKLGYRDIQPNIADKDKSSDELASAFQTKKIR